MTKSSPGRANRRQAAKASSAKGGGEPGHPRERLAMTAGPSLEIPVENLGYPGSLTELHIVPQLPGTTRSDQDILADGSEREFEAVALLSKAPSPASAMNFQFDERDGDSYFMFSPPKMAVDTLWGSPQGLFARTRFEERPVNIGGVPLEACKQRCWTGVIIAPAG